MPCVHCTSLTSTARVTPSCNNSVTCLAAAAVFLASSPTGVVSQCLLQPPSSSIFIICYLSIILFSLKSQSAKILKYMIVHINKVIFSNNNTIHLANWVEESLIRDM